MMNGHEKSDLVIVAMKPANKAKKATCGGVCGGGRSGVGGVKGGGQGEYAPAKHVLDSESGSLPFDIRLEHPLASAELDCSSSSREETIGGGTYIKLAPGTDEATIRVISSTSKSLSS